MKASRPPKEPLNHAHAIKLLKRAVLLLEHSPRVAATTAGYVAYNSDERSVRQVARAIESLAIDLVFWGPLSHRPASMTATRAAEPVPKTARRIRFPRIRFRKAQP